MVWVRSTEVQFKRIPVDANDLSTGMYVVMLDRPWLETPFVCQGGEVKDQQDQHDNRAINTGNGKGAENTHCLGEQLDPTITI